MTDPIEKQLPAYFACPKHIRIPNVSINSSMLRASLQDVIFTTLLERHRRVGHAHQMEKLTCNSRPGDCELRQNTLIEHSKCDSVYCSIRVY